MGINVRCSQRGVTLIELVIAIVIVTIALGALMQSWAFNVGGSADPLLQRKSLKLAQLYSDEILSKRFDENSPLGGGTVSTVNCPAGSGLDTGESLRSDYDDVDDFNAIIDSPPQDIHGNALPQYSAYQVSISVSCITGKFAIATANHIKRIDVAVTAPATNNSFTLSVYRANF